MINTIVLTKTLLAATLGALIGLEREFRKEPAGLRTHTLVCLASSFLTAVSFTMFSLDTVGRIAAGIITGIGFLGAGTIISHGDRIRGLTTAASIWSVSGLGIVIGFGRYTLSMIIAVLIVLILELKIIEEFFTERIKKKGKT